MSGFVRPWAGSFRTGHGWSHPGPSLQCWQGTPTHGHHSYGPYWRCPGAVPGWVLAMASSSWTLRRISCCRPASETPTCGRTRLSRLWPGRAGGGAGSWGAIHDGWPLAAGTWGQPEGASSRAGRVIAWAGAPTTSLAGGEAEAQKKMLETAVVQQVSPRAGPPVGHIGRAPRG